MKHVATPFWTSSIQPLMPIRSWLGQLDIHSQRWASLITHLIPAQCPFARTIRLGRYTIIEIPPLCKLNPLYDELMELRFRALSYLAEAGLVE